MLVDLRHSFSSVVAIVCINKKILVVKDGSLLHPCCLCIAAAFSVAFLQGLEYF